MKIVINSIGLQQLYGSALPSNGIVDEIVYQKESLEHITKMDIKPLVESKAIELDKIDIDKEKPGFVSTELVFKNFNW